MIFKRFKNDLLARRYMLEQLGGGTTLARLVAEDTALQRGGVFVALPMNINPDDLSEFRWEIDDLQSTDAQVLFKSLVARFINDARCEVLFQDTMGKPSDPWTERFAPKQRMVLLGEEIYWKLKAPTADKEICTVINCGSPYPYSAFFRASVNNAETPSSIIYDDLKQIAREIVGIATDAFDATSFVVWWREDSYRFPLSD